MAISALTLSKAVFTKNRNGIIDSALVQEPVEIETQLGTFMPSFSVGGSARKKEAPVKLYPNGKIKSLPLEDAAEIQTPIGTITSELVTFYEDGALKRVFPLNGKISGFWSEKDEYKLAEEITISCYGSRLVVKPIYIQFYETGEIESAAFWPQERISLDTPVGNMIVRNGVSFHKSGMLRTCEPANPVSISTRIGIIEAFDPDPDAICAENASLQFSTDGSIASLLSVKHSVHATVEHSRETVYSPKKVISMCSDLVKVVQPLKICFWEKAVVFGRGNTCLGSETYDTKFRVSDFE